MRFYKSKDGSWEPVLIVVYVDDFLVVGNRENATSAHKEIEKALGFTPKEDYECEEFIGIQAEPLDNMKDGSRRIIMHQTTYAQHLVDDFEKDHYGGKALRHVSTPSLVRDEVGRSVPAYVPDLKATAQKHGGGLLWLCRGIRPDLCAAVTKITRRYTVWDRECDHLLFRIFQYLKGTVNLGIVLYGHPDDWNTLQFAVECDADHGGDPA